MFVGQVMFVAEASHIMNVSSPLLWPLSSWTWISSCPCLSSSGTCSKRDRGLARFLWASYLSRYEYPINNVEAVDDTQSADQSEWPGLSFLHPPQDYWRKRHCCLYVRPVPDMCHWSKLKSWSYWNLSEGWTGKCLKQCKNAQTIKYASNL